MKREGRAPLMLFIVAVATLAADQLTKELIRLNIGPNEAVPEQGAFRLINVTNDGIIFGLGAPRWLAIAMPVILVTVILLAY